MTYINYFTLLLFIFLISCSQADPGNNKHNNYPETFSINKELINNGILQINLPKNRPKNMSIMSPSGNWFIIQSKEDSIETIPHENFSKSKAIEFSIPELKGAIWKKGKRLIKNVFVEKGEYLIYFANNLETEPENTFSFSQKIIFGQP